MQNRGDKPLGSQWVSDATLAQNTKLSKNEPGQRPAQLRKGAAKNPTAIFSCNQLILTTGRESKIVEIPERLSKGVLENSKTVLTAHHRPS